MTSLYMKACPKLSGSLPTQLGLLPDLEELEFSGYQLKFNTTDLAMFGTMLEDLKRLKVFKIKILIHQQCYYCHNYSREIRRMLKFPGVEIVEETKCNCRVLLKCALRLHCAYATYTKLHLRLKIII